MEERRTGSVQAQFKIRYSRTREFKGCTVLPESQHINVRKGVRDWTSIPSYLRYWSHECSEISECSAALALCTLMLNLWMFPHPKFMTDLLNEWSHTSSSCLRSSHSLPRTVFKCWSSHLHNEASLCTSHQSFLAGHCVTMLMDHLHNEASPCPIQNISELP